ncbi:MAG: transcription termination factor Rho [Candidatus Levybacteria bacterium CG10_big_fil_rev_8_21_14_0_10_35_13]|nr:MAG: transcription termination factor Rho [Candidatus Levybacteria bacterium CG10_big_fil_rev_8_21_14_0_10_35_13]
MPVRKKIHSASSVRAHSTSLAQVSLKQSETPVEDIIGKPASASTSTSNVAGVNAAKAEESTETLSEPAITEASANSQTADRFNSQRYEPQATPTYPVSGILDIQPEGHGFLRPKFIPSHRDIYISQSQIRRFMLRPGDLVDGVGRPPKDTERYFGLLKVEKVNGLDADDSLNRPYFDDLTPIYPKKQIVLTTGKLPLSTRMIDLIAPIGFGQRGMIVSPPKAGKTTVLKELAAGISQNFPNVHLMAALIGERPEEVTDITSSVKGEVVASNFDEPPENQTRVAEITLDRAKRMVEMGKDVIILLDSITRLARAYNLSVAPSGRTLSGGFDPAALWPAKRFFGAARNCQEGGSLTIIGTALVDTGSRMDDLIYEEFKGTGNMELHLDRRLADKRVYPSIDIEKSGTRQEELIMDDVLRQKTITMRRMLYMLSDDERTSLFIEKLAKTATNEEFLATLQKG